MGTQLLITFFFSNFEIIETVSPAVTERNMDNEAVQVHENEKSQNDDGEQSLEQQNESLRNQKTEDTAISENDMRPGETKERTEEKNHKRIDRPNTGKMQMMFVWRNKTLQKNHCILK